MKSGFSRVVTAYIPIPKDKFKSSKDCVACPITKNYALIGTAFDYLFRSELKRIHTISIEKSFVAESSIALVKQRIKAEGFFQAKNKKIGEAEFSAMRSIAKKYKRERTSFIKSGVLTDNFIDATVRFARMDAVFRAGIYDDIENDVDPSDIEDMKALYNLIPEWFKNSHSRIMLDPTFGGTSLMVGGADVDLIIDNIIIDIKTTKEMKLNEYFWSQIVGYLILADKALEIQLIDRDKSFSIEIDLPIIESLGLYFSRYGYLWKVEADYVRKNPNYEALKKKFWQFAKVYAKTPEDQLYHSLFGIIE